MIWGDCARIYMGFDCNLAWIWPGFWQILTMILLGFGWDLAAILQQYLARDCRNY